MRLFRSGRWLLLALLISLLPASSHAGIFISVGFAPPVLPVYVQPPCPEPNLMWMPGYWHYGPFGYYWVPGAWVPAPYEGALWTPGYWGWSGGLYAWHEGYWGPHVGYYGGVNYGFGYGGLGFAGGEWRGGVFAYNTAVINVNKTIIHTTYINRTIVEQNTIANPSHAAFNGPGGVQHQPTPQETTAMHETHLPPTKFQQQHIETAKADKTSYAKNNGGHPKNVAVAKPLPAETHPAPPELKNQAKPAANPAPKPEAKAPAIEVAKPAPKPEAKPMPNTESKAPVRAAPPAPKPAANAPPKASAPPKATPKPAGKPKPEPKEK